MDINFYNFLITFYSYILSFQRKRAASQEKRKARRQFNFSPDDPNVQQKVTDLVEDLSSRPTKSKTSVRKLRYLKRVLESLSAGKGIPVKGAKVANQIQPKPQASKPAQQKKVPQPKPANKQKKVPQPKSADKPEQEEVEIDDSVDEEEESDDNDATLDTSTLTQEDSDDLNDDDQDEEDDDDDEEDDDDDEEDDDGAENDSEDDDAEDDDAEDDDDDEDENDNEDEKQESNNVQAKPSKPVPPPKDNNDEKKKRYVLFVANLPWTCKREDITEHFKKVGELVDVRIPMSQENKPRGFAYVEVKDQQAFEVNTIIQSYVNGINISIIFLQKGLSLEGTFIGGRPIRVQYSESGKKKSEYAKNNFKAKNFKLQAMRAKGQLNGSVRHDQKRSFRRGKQQRFNSSQ